MIYVLCGCIPCVINLIIGKLYSQAVCLSICLLTVAYGLFTPPTRTRQDSFVSSASAVWTSHYSIHVDPVLRSLQWRPSLLKSVEEPRPARCILIIRISYNGWQWWFVMKLSYVSATAMMISVVNKFINNLRQPRWVGMATRAVTKRSKKRRSPK